MFKDIIKLKLPLHNNEIKLDKDTAFYAETMRKLYDILGGSELQPWQLEVGGEGQTGLALSAGARGRHERHIRGVLGEEQHAVQPGDRDGTLLHAERTQKWLCVITMNILLWMNCVYLKFYIMSFYMYVSSSSCF